jgi:DNA-binding beta-propeller fold protein YncE
VQSIEVHNSKAYIVVNNAGKIEVADGSTFAATGTITGFTYPRFFKGISSTKAYVSEWGAGGVSGNVKVVNLSSNTITATLPTGKGAEAILVTGGKAYVACGGGFDNDSVVTVIDANADTVMNSIVVGPNPKNLVKDANGDIWILCAGAWDPTFTFLQYPGRLVRINASTGAITLSLPFSSGYSQPSSLVSNSAGTTLYFNYDGGIYSHNVTSSTLSGSPIIPRAFYSLGLDPVSGHLFAGDAGNFSSNGKVLRYTTAGAVVDSFATGIIPGNFYFK